MFLRYLLVSVLALVVDAVVLAIGIRLLALSPELAAGLGYAVGALVHYRISRTRVFARGWLGEVPVVEFAVFAASGACGLLVTMGVVRALSGGFGVDIVYSKAAAVAVSFFCVYLLRVSVVFRAPSR